MISAPQVTSKRCASRRKSPTPVIPCGDKAVQFITWYQELTSKIVAQMLLVPTEGARAEPQKQVPHLVGYREALPGYEL